MWSSTRAFSSARCRNEGALLMDMPTLSTATAPGTLGAAASVSHEVVVTATPSSPNQRAWARFKRNRLGYFALWAFVAMLVVSTLAELISNDRPFVAKVDGRWFFPMVQNPSDRELGGDFDTPVDWH